MATAQKYIDLINADLDGEIGAGEKDDLDAFLAESAEGRALYTDLEKLSGSLDTLESVSPPPRQPDREPRQRPTPSGMPLRDAGPAGTASKGRPSRPPGPPGLYKSRRYQALRPSPQGGLSF